MKKCCLICGRCPPQPASRPTEGLRGQLRVRSRSRDERTKCPNRTTRRSHHVLHTLLTADPRCRARSACSRSHILNYGRPHPPSDRPTKHLQPLHTVAQVAPDASQNEVARNVVTENAQSPHAAHRRAQRWDAAPNGCSSGGPGWGSLGRRNYAYAYLSREGSRRSMADDSASDQDEETVVRNLAREVVHSGGRRLPRACRSRHSRCSS